MLILEIEKKGDNMPTNFKKIPKEVREIMLNDFKNIIVDLESKRDTLGNDIVNEKIAELRRQIQEIEKLNQQR
jgi:excinuclease UvrABC nuclease subunit